MKKILILTVVSLVITACGGGNSNENSNENITPTSPEMSENPPVITPPVTPTTYTGVFIDSAVEGLTYKTATQQGKTNINGEFIYQSGEMVTFSIGGVSFPPVSVKEKITPLDVFNTEDLNNKAVVNMLRLLQSLDIDGQPENGITIVELAHTLTENITISFTDSNFETLLNEALVSYSGVNTRLISEVMAVQHFRNTLMLNEPIANSCGGQNHPKVGYTGTFNAIAHNVSGTVTITDNCTIVVENFNYDATAPAVYFYGDTQSDFLSDKAFIIGGLLRDDSVDYVNEKITLRLPNNKTLDDLEYLSVWCVDFAVNFGDLRFQAP